MRNPRITRTLLLLLFSIAGALVNIAFWFPIAKAGVYLYMDTVFTIALTFCGGVFWGILCGVLTSVISGFYYGNWPAYFFVVCQIATALIVWLFMRLFPRELSIATRGAGNPEPPSVILDLQSRRLVKVMDRVIVLVLLSFGLCIAMSVLGGFIASLIQIIDPVRLKDPNITVPLSDTLFRNFPLILDEILSRFPINIVDRLIAVFAGFGIAAGVNKLTRNRRYSAIAQ